MAGKVDELEKTIFVAAKDPSLYGIKQVELEKRRKWTTTSPIQVGNIKKAVIVAGRSSNFGGMRQKLMRIPKSHQQHDKDRTRTRSYAVNQTHRCFSSDEELYELSASVERIGSVGLTIHDELLSKEKIIEDLGSEMESTSNRLDFVQNVFSSESHRDKMVLKFLMEKNSVNALHRKYIPSRAGPENSNAQDEPEKKALRS
uniref:t-SNARE coiled-coil homology domain-containing protein n=1 Tax=Lactuca sativa TaxID=4236 RepID=A0A9R1XUS5_LACSA|nr:hypothetical protein LSAT_V11C100035910 [Lactuca sativa]